MDLWYHVVWWTNEGWPIFRYSWWEVHHASLLLWCCHLSVVMNLSYKNAVLFPLLRRNFRWWICRWQAVIRGQPDLFYHENMLTGYFLSQFLSTTNAAYDTLWFAASLMVCIVVHNGVSYPGYSQYRGKISVSWHHYSVPSLVDTEVEVKG